MKIKRRRLFLILFIVVISALCMGGFMFFRATKTYVFEESQRVIDNPMQGFYIQIDSAEKERIEALPEKGVHLVLLAYNLNGFQQQELTEEKLQELREALETAKQNKIQVIFRAAYGFAEGMLTREPEELTEVSVHIRQMAAILNEYSEILVCVQAGLLGPWGEWHSSSFFTGPEAETKARNQVAGWWHEALAESIQLQLRTPQYIRDAAGAGIPLARLGFHNDAFMSSQSDMGTYTGSENARTEEIAWLEKNLPHSRTGGEAVQVGPNAAADRSIPEFEKLGLTYLNRKYNEEVIDSWDIQSYQGENALEYIRKRFGSRLYLYQVKMPARIPEARINNKISLSLQNSGFAAARADLQYFLVAKQGETAEYRELTLKEANHHSLRLEGRIFFAGLERNQPTALGIWVGYGGPGEGMPYMLANEEGLMAEEICFFTELEYRNGYWEITD